VELPYFEYHPDPLQTGAIVQTDRECLCCGMSRGYIYVGPVYAKEDYDESICPWCIADGSAASKLDASFADSVPLLQAGVPKEIAEEVNLRTPGYTSWQQENWLSHCGDACEFHGDATIEDVKNASFEQNEDGWNWATNGYNPGGDSALYKFKCRHCGMVLLSWDLS